jgi:membrane-bound inhibitor of C-type lysozyme
MEMADIIALAAILGVGGDVTGSSVQVMIALSGDAERRIVRYECDGVQPFAVEYVNAAPNFLALVPVEGHTMVFANVAAASGARYVAGSYEWWTRGAEATFADTLRTDAEPVTCLEHSETP